MSLLTKLPAEPGMNKAAESEIALADDGETEANLLGRDSLRR